MEVNIKHSQILRKDYKRYIRDGISYDQYKIQMAEDFQFNEDEKVKSYIQLNQSRMHRVEKTYAISENITHHLNTSKNKTYWLVLTEHWCGDASQILPVLNAIAKASHGNIELKLVYRDENPELMDAYLTDGTRSIPKLIQLDTHFDVTGIWGPRPGVAQNLVKVLKSNPETAQSYANQLHLWYAKDKQRTIDMEIEKLLQSANLFCADRLT